MPSAMIPASTPVWSSDAGTAIVSVPLDSLIGSPSCGCGNASVLILTTIVPVLGGNSSPPAARSTFELHVLLIVADAVIVVCWTGNVVGGDVTVVCEAIVVVGASVVGGVVVGA